MACWSCGRSDVRKRPRAGKQHFPHRCPHGRVCIAGTRYGISGWNYHPIGGPYHCPDCYAAQRGEKRGT